jgi:hypothetical protein
MKRLAALLVALAACLSVAMGSTASFPWPR